MNKKDRRKELRSFLPLFWNSYQHMYDVRATNTQSRINFLLVIISILSLICFELSRISNLFLIPLIPQTIAFLLLLKVFFIEPPQIHWFNMTKFLSKEIVLEDIQNGKLDRNLVAELKSREDDTWSYLVDMGKIVRASIRLLLLSLFLIMLLSIIIYFSNWELYIAIFFLIVSSLLIYSYYKKQPPYAFEGHFENYKKQIDGWLNLKP